jgi:hypothetical protein
LAGDNKELSQQPRVIRFHVGYTNNVSVGHNEYVDRSTRIDIVKGCHILILIKDACRSLSTHDSAENAITHCAIPQ